MKKSRYMEEQIIRILKQHQASIVTGQQKLQPGNFDGPDESPSLRLILCWKRVKLYYWICFLALSFVVAAASFNGFYDKNKLSDTVGARMDL